MKIATTLSRVLLGLIFLLSGLVFFFSPSEMPLNAAGKAFMSALVPSGYFAFIKVLEIIGGLLLLSGRFVPLGLLIIGPILVNVLAFDIFLDRTALPIGIVLSGLYLFLLWRNQAVFRPFLAAPQPI